MNERTLSQMIEDYKPALTDVAAMKVDYGLTDSEINQIARELENIPNEHWYYCTFRNSWLTCLYGNADVDNKSEMSWLPSSEGATTLKRLTEEVIFPMTDKKPRLIIIRTWPGTHMNLHTDCSPDEIDLFQPKLRLVVKGQQNTLYFVNENGEKVHIPDEWHSYVMTGTALHGMDNEVEEKFTVCWGDPWEGDDLRNEKFASWIINNYEKYKDTAILKSSLGNVNHVSAVKDKQKHRLYSWEEYNEAFGNSAS
jgi:hypothetical protein